MKIDYANRRARHKREIVQQAVAAIGAGLSVPVARMTAEGKPSDERLPITLDMIGQQPGVYMAWLWDAMQRTGKGFQRPPQGRRQPDGAARWRGKRRADKPGTTKLSRTLAGLNSVRMTHFPAMA